MILARRRLPVGAPAPRVHLPVWRAGHRAYTPRMNSTRRLAFLLALIALAGLAGCGNKGDLVRPADVPPAAAAPAADGAS